LQNTKPGDSIRQIKLSCIHEKDVNPFSSGNNSMSTNKRSLVKNTLKNSNQIKKSTDIINISVEELIRIEKPSPLFNGFEYINTQSDDSLGLEIDRKQMFKGNVVGITIRYIEERWTDTGKNIL
jgi:hypothetical protein